MTTASDMSVDVEGQQLRYCGIGSKYEEIIIKGDPMEMKVREIAMLSLDTRTEPKMNLTVYRLLRARREGRRGSEVSKKHFLSSFRERAIMNGHD